MSGITELKGADGFKEFSPSKLKYFIGIVSEGLEVDQDAVYDATVSSLSNMVSTNDVYSAVIYAACAFIERDPDYDTLACRVLLRKMRRECWNVSTEYGSEIADEEYRGSFQDSLWAGIKDGRLDPRMGLDGAYNEEYRGLFDWNKLSDALVPERDELFKYVGLGTLIERYLRRDENGRLLEMPQSFWMRVAMGLAYNEDNPTDRAIEFYEVLSKLWVISSTPTLLQSGTTHPQLASCFLGTVDDSLASIYKAYLDNAYLSKWSGGIGTDWSQLRATGAEVKSAGIQSQGVIPFLKIENDSTIAISRSGKRKGARVAYLATWHLDIEDFLDLRRSTGDERRRTHDLHTANWIPDIFMCRVRDDAEWTLFSPDEVPHLNETYGEEFDRHYTQYEQDARDGKLKLFKVVKAVDLYRRMITRLSETGHSWMVWSTPSNLRNPQSHCGIVRSSNLCCVAGDDRAVTDFGIIKVRDLAQQYGPVDVAGRDGTSAASEMVLTIPDSPILKVTSKDGYTHRVTPDHPLWVKDEGWVEAQELEPGDVVEIQQTHGMWGPVDEPELAFIAGMVAGDGTYGGNSVCIDIWDVKTGQFKEELERCVHNVLQKHSDKYTLRTGATDTPSFNESTGGGKWRMSSKPVADILSFFGFTKNTKLVVPEFVWRGNYETVSNYLRGLLVSDATLQCPDGGATISLSSTNRQLLEDVQVLILNAGVKSRIRGMYGDRKVLMPDGRGGQKLYDCKANYRLLVTSTKCCRRLNDMVELGEARGHTQFLESIKKEGYADKFYTVIESVEPDGVEDTYCLNVFNEDRAWTCNGFVTKNTEITLNTSEDQVSVCNLGSINLARFDEYSFKLNSVVATAVRMLDNVIDINFYPIPEARNSNLRHRPIGLGVMGYQDYLWQNNVSFEESGHVAGDLADDIQFYAIEASVELAKERGPYESFMGSTWSRGELTPYTRDKLVEYRESIGESVPGYKFSSPVWRELAQDVQEYGIRNSNITAIAPTASIGTIAGVLCPCIEPMYSNIFVETNMRGDFVITNPYLIKELKEYGIWGPQLLEEIKLRDGSIQGIEAIPEYIQEKYKTAFEVDQFKLVDIAARRARYIDQSQSLNIFYDGDSGQYLSDLYFHAWRSGLKSTYYLRTKKASRNEKATVDVKYGMTQLGDVAQCRIDDPDCEACQ